MRNLSTFPEFCKDGTSLAGQSLHYPALLQTAIAKPFLHHSSSGRDNRQPAMIPCPALASFNQFTINAISYGLPLRLAPCFPFGLPTDTTAVKSYNPNVPQDLRINANKHKSMISHCPASVQGEHSLSVCLQCGFFLTVPLLQVQSHCVTVYYSRTVVL